MKPLNFKIINTKYCYAPKNKIMFKCSGDSDSFCYSSVSINNFHKVDDTLYRGAMPLDNEIKQLKSIGVSEIINFRYGDDFFSPIAKEAELAKENGLIFHHLPILPDQKPSKEIVDKFFEITDKARENGRKVFIHCRHGADRTGLFVSLYKLRNQDVSLFSVLSELKKFGHNSRKFPQVIQFIKEYSENLDKSKPLN